MTHGELFAGISGFGLGFKRAGIETIWHVEKDKACQSVLRRHYPGTLLLDDVKDCGAHNLPYADIISFGSPCQDLSVAGKRKGITGERSGLFFEAIRIIRELRPAIAIWENVPGAFSSHGGRDFGAALDALAQSGALDIGWAVLDAQWFGVAQRRRRVFVVADFTGQRAGEILSIPAGLPGDTPPRREAGATAAATITERFAGGSNQWAPYNEADNLIAPPLTSNYYGDHESREGLLVAPPLCASGRGTERAGESRGQDPVIAVFGGNNTSGEIDVSTALNAHGGTGWIDFESETFIAFNARRAIASPQDNVSPALNPGGGGSQSPAVAFSAGNSGDSYGIAYDEELTTPLRAGASGTNQTPTAAGVFGVRRLTPVECARLQGFPDDWGSWQSDSIQYRQYGNAVCVNVAEWIGHQLLRAIEGGEA